MIQFFSWLLCGLGVIDILCIVPLSVVSESS
jgi:hypothetical protein